MHAEEVGADHIPSIHGHRRVFNWGLLEIDESAMVSKTYLGEGWRCMAVVKGKFG